MPRRRPIRVAAFTRYDREAASTRQRLLQYLPALNAANIEVDYQPLLSDDYVRSIATGRRLPRIEILLAYARRARAILAARRAGVVWVYAELLPFLPGWMERLALAGSGPLVYDFDDAFFHNYDASPNRLVRALLGRKLEPLLRRASACACGNAYLQDYASRFCRNSIVLPTVVDSERYRPRSSLRDTRRPLVIGWIGSPSTWPYVRPLLPMLREIVGRHGVRIRIVGAGSQAESASFPGLDLVQWSEEGEVGEVQAMDIGLMPVADEIWAKGKSGYKLIQYMACGLPVIASPVGVNSEIVSDGTNGFLATTVSEWRSRLELLIGSAELRERMGAAGRATVEKHYSLHVQAPRLIALIESVAQGASKSPE